MIRWSSGAVSSDDFAVSYNLIENTLMNSRYRIFYTVALCLAILLSCTGGERPSTTSEQKPPIFPDYVEVTVPCNIAPMNFMIEGADRIRAAFFVEGTEVLDVVGKKGVLEIPLKEWKGLMAQAEGKNVDVKVAQWCDEYPDGVEYALFCFHVSPDKIDEWMAYRLIEPGYRSWRQVGLYQRNLTSFEETAIVTNAVDNETCLNCHHFPAYSSESMMFHARGANGGTILYHEGELEKIRFNEIGPKKNTTYPAWHPDGRYIAFSANTTRQIFHMHGKKPIEVYDNASDLVLYDTETGEVLTDPRFMTAEVLETFPAWAPDGRRLYYAAANAADLPDELEKMHYHLLSVSFDPQSRTFGGKIDTLYNADVSGGSVSHPRISPDGRYLLYAWSRYGTFPVWHEEADLAMIDLQTGRHADVSQWNDPDNSDSYHSWSSSGRWVVIGSRRTDGRYTRLFLAHLAEDGTVGKPFLLPQEDPRYNLWRLKSYNVPEFIDGKVELPDEVTELFQPEK